MIKLEKANKCRRCNSCNSGNNVYEVTVLNRLNQGMQIALCPDCLRELVSLSQMTLHSEGKERMVSSDEIEDSAEKPLDISN